MSGFRSLMTAVVLLAGLPTMALADSSLNPGRLVKIQYKEKVSKRLLLVVPYTETERHSLVGTVLSLTADSVSVRPRYEDEAKTFSREQIEKVYNHRGRKRATWRGTKIGAGVGGTFAFLLLMPARDRTEEPDIKRLADFEDRIRAGVYSIGVCAAVGGVIGYFSSTDRWERMPIEVTPDSSRPDTPGIRIQLVAKF